MINTNYLLDSIKSKISHIGGDLLENDEGYTIDELIEELLKAAIIQGQDPAPGLDEFVAARAFLQEQLKHMYGEKQFFTAPEVCTATTKMQDDLTVYHLINKLYH
ncbi:MAG: hypothetical protein AABX08_02735 [Nanoarchaeota archaeon]